MKTFQNVIFTKKRLSSAHKSTKDLHGLKIARSTRLSLTPEVSNFRYKGPFESADHKSKIELMSVYSQNLDPIEKEDKINEFSSPGRKAEKDLLQTFSNAAFIIENEHREELELLEGTLILKRYL